MSETQTFPALPQGHKRFTVEQLIREVGPTIGLGAPAQVALIHMMGHTAPDDWTSPNREPIYFAPQDVTAAALGKTRRALYNTEKQLERLGLIERRIKANGHRSPYGGCGIVFSRLIALVPDLLNLLDRLRREKAERRTLRNLRSTFKGIVLKHVREAGDAPHPRIEAAAEALASWPDARRLETMAIDALRAHVEEVKNVTDALAAGGDEGRDSSAMGEESCTPHLQENNQEHPSVICNAGMDQRSAGKPAHDESFLTGPVGPERGREIKCATASGARKTQFVSRLTPERLFGLASEDMKALIADSQGRSRQLRTVDLIDAAVRILPSLGINYDAWEKAVEAMGEEQATLAVFLIDANRDHPRTPVRNPGGALRAMTGRHRKGTLNLVGSLIGLARRKNA
jgi:replication initiation protein RepC